MSGQGRPVLEMYLSVGADEYREESESQMVLGL